MQEDIEADEIEERQVQIIGRRIVNVGDERVRRFALDVVMELFEETLDRKSTRLNSSHLA